MHRVLKPRDSAYLSSRIPAEWIGRARALRTQIAKEHELYEDAAESIVSYFRPIPGFSHQPRHARPALLAEIPRKWKSLPSFGRLKLFAEFNKKTGELKIVDTRCSPTEVKCQAWENDEPALAIWAYSISIDAGLIPPTFREIQGLGAGLGLHSIARRYQRCTIRSDASVLADFGLLAKALPAAIEARGPFAIPTSNGKWVGEIVKDEWPTPYALVRTYIDD